MSVLNENTIIGASAAGGEFEINHSLRLHNRGGDGASTGKTLRRTPSVNSNRRTWTLSMWHKRGDLNHVQIQDLFFGTGAGGGGDGVVRLRFERGLYATKDKLWLSLDGPTPGVNAVTNQLFRDASAWMHIVLRFDTTQSTVTDRARIYINGEVISSTDYSHLWTSAWSNLAQNSEWAVNKAGWYESFAGTGSTSNPDNVLGGYLADIAFVDGQSLGPDSFGETGDYGEWKPIDVSALTFGTNGYHLDFADASAMGNDANGSNNFSVYNITANDQMLDSPTNNFCTFNPIDQRQSNPVIFREGNLKFTLVSGSQSRGTIPSTVDNKFYLEFCTPSDVSNTNVMHLGLTSPYIDINASGSVAAGTGGATVMTYFGGNDYWMAAVENGVDVGSLINVPGTKIAAGGIVGFAYDAATGKVWMSINNSWLKADGSFDGTNPLSSTNFIKQFSAGTQLTPATMPVGNFVGVLNCGQDSSFAGNKTAQGNQDSNGIGDFYYAPPTGFLALCTANLPEPDVIPSEHFNAVLYTGNGADNHAISGVGFQPDFVWMKSRSASRSHALVDSVRGRGSILFSDSSGAQQVPAAANNDLVSFDTDGFTVGTPERAGSTNENNDTIVAWNWKAGGTASSNTNGSATSQVSANVDAGISIATFTLPTTATTIGHGLSKAPELVIHKGRVSGSAWWTFHKDIGNTSAVRLDSSGAAGASTNFWNNTSPTSTVVTIGANSGNNNSWMMYCFHSVDGYSRVGSYTGNTSSTDGTFVHCGFAVSFLLIKDTGAGNTWVLLDSKRDSINPNDTLLQPQSTAAETTGWAGQVDFLSNGFKIRSNDNALNAARTYIFYAIAANPFKHTNAR